VDVSDRHLIMKKLAVIVAFFAAAALHAQTVVTFNFFVGTMANAGGTPVSNGSLVQFIASPDTTFGAPTPGSFVSGNDVILASRSVDSSTGGQAGVVYISVSSVDLSVAGIAPGSFLAVRWFPTLTPSSTTPGNSTPYGQWGYANDSAWVVPTSSGLIDLSFQTASAFGGSAANSAGYASLSTAAIPEPSTYAAILGALCFLLVGQRRRRVSP
jgi:hypothetical protein